MRTGGRSRRKALPAPARRSASGCRSAPVWRRRRKGRRAAHEWRFRIHGGEAPRGGVMENIIVPLGGMFMIVAIVMGFPIVRTLPKRIEKQSVAPQSPADVTARLERIEQSIDAVALEVERIAEGQRFTTKLLSDRTTDRDGVRLSDGGRI